VARPNAKKGNDFVGFRCPRELKEKIVRAAGKQPVSDFLRELITRALEVEK